MFFIPLFGDPSLLTSVWGLEATTMYLSHLFAGQSPNAYHRGGPRACLALSRRIRNALGEPEKNQKIRVIIMAFFGICMVILYLKHIFKFLIGFFRSGLA